VTCRRSRCVAMLLIALSVIFASAATTAAAAHVCDYDAPAISRVHVRTSGGADFGSAQFMRMREGSASPSVEARAKSTTPVFARNIATNTARGGAGPVRVGQQGLDALGVTQNTTRIALPGGGYRVPDILDEAAGVIGEVKNVQSLSYTSQLRDYVSYAQVNQLQFDLYVRGSTQLSGPLQQAIDDGFINLWRSLPG
jgi:hypothetical protein